ncbi:MAG: hypothetical protein GEU74_04020 [Nitriliruptorales bacterium]|nr:hypothetical protein [Nitriliruptorales bacterium]
MEIDEARALVQLAVAARARLGTDEEDEWAERLRARTGDVGPAVDALLVAGEVDAALTLAGALGAFWLENGLVTEGRAITSAVLTATAGATTAPYARAQLALGELAFRQGDQEVAADATSTARAVAENLDDQWVRCRAEINLARIAFRDAAADRIFEHARRAHVLAGDDVRLRAAAVHMLGWGEYMAGNLGAAIAHFEENAGTYRVTGDRLGQAAELANIGDLLAEAGDVEGAAQYLRRSLEVPGLRENRYLGPALVRSAGVLCAMRQEHVAALELIGAADALYDEFGLTADPGDDVPHEVMHATVEAVGREHADQLCARGAAWSLDEALEAAARAL